MSFFIARVRKFARRWKRTSAPPADDAPNELSCRELVELVTAYFDRALSERDTARFEAHLAACEGCTRYVQQMRDTVRLAGTLSEEQVPSEARERLLEAFRGWSSGTEPGNPPGQ